MTAQEALALWRRSGDAFGGGAGLYELGKHALATGDSARARVFLEECLAVARGLGARGVALPAVGAGAYGWPAPEAARALVGAAVADVAAHPGLEVVRFVLTSERLLEAFRDQLGSGR